MLEAGTRLAGVHSVFSTQNFVQQELAARFERLALASQEQPPVVPVHALELRDLATDGAASATFQSEAWYRALVLKTSHWASVAAARPGEVLVCADNDITLLPGWVAALPAACAPGLDLCFQREGGDDPFFEAFPYNSGLFLMRCSAATAAFWREVSRRTAAERPFAGDQTIVNAMLHRRCDASGLPTCIAPAGLRHGHFEPHAVAVGGPQLAPSNATLRLARAHHATASGSPEDKLLALEAFQDKWMAARSL